MEKGRDVTSGNDKKTPCVQGKSVRVERNSIASVGGGKEVERRISLKGKKKVSALPMYERTGEGGELRNLEEKGKKKKGFFGTGLLTRWKKK